MGILLSHLQPCFATKGTIVSFKAPIIQMRADEESPRVLEVKTAGDDVEILNAHSLIGGEYYQIHDRAGNEGLIHRDYVKLHYADHREKSESLHYKHPQKGYDTTDYRLKEPIPKSYPFADEKFSKVDWNIGIGTNTKSHYAYQQNLEEQTFSQSYSFDLSLMKTMSREFQNRSFYGLKIQFKWRENEVTFQNGANATEGRFVLGMGPNIDYQFFQGEHLLGIFESGFTWNYHQSTVSINPQNIDADPFDDDSSNTIKEYKDFKGFSLSPYFTLKLGFPTGIKDTDFYFSQTTTIQLPYNESSKDETNNPTYWDKANPNKSSHELAISADFHLGFSYRY